MTLISLVGETKQNDVERFCEYTHQKLAPQLTAGLTALYVENTIIHHSSTTLLLISLHIL